MLIHPLIIAMLLHLVEVISVSIIWCYMIFYVNESPYLYKSHTLWKALFDTFAVLLKERKRIHKSCAQR